MDIHPKDLSLEFYRFLCDIIGTKGVVKKRRHIYLVLTEIEELGNMSVVTSGSKAEGLNLHGSDHDHMLIINDYKVYERSDRVNNQKERPFLIMDTENTKPGFTKLLINHLETHFLFGLIDRRTGLSYLSSTMVRETFCDDSMMSQLGCYIHGPYTASHCGRFDFAISLHCPDWISQALPWITRSKYSWASDKIIQNVLSFGVLFVPIGSKNSINADIEWRISFSYAEQQLICSFNHVQLLCYALLKILLKDIIRETFEDLLCSYFMKTIMFWLCEETDISCWIADNITTCFMACFQRLIYCVENKTCLHYFIPENNLFENRFEKQHKQLLLRLHGLYDQGWICFLQTETLQSFRSYLGPSLLSTIDLATYLPCLNAFNYETSNDMNDDNGIVLTEKCLRKIIKSRTKKDIYMFLLCRLYQCLSQKILDEKIVQDNNKMLYKQFIHRLSHLLIGLNHDAVSGLLLLASFFFKEKQYIICRILIDHCLIKFTPEKCELIYGLNRRKVLNFTNLQNITEEFYDRRGQIHGTFLYYAKLIEIVGRQLLSARYSFIGLCTLFKLCFTPHS